MLAFLTQVKLPGFFTKCLIDNATFRLHYKVQVPKISAPMTFLLFFQFSFALLSLASLLTTLKENFGDPIDCIVDKEVPKSVFKVFHKLQTSGQRNTRPS